MHSVCSPGCSSYEGAYEEQDDIDIKEEPLEVSGGTGPLLTFMLLPLQMGWFNVYIFLALR